MNLSKALHSLGFRKVQNLKIETFNRWNINGIMKESSFILDDSPSKWQWTYVYSIGGDIRVVAQVFKQNDLSLYVENLKEKNITHVSVWVDKSKTNKIDFNSKNKILSLLPKEIQRDILISRITRCRQTS